ncbi:ATP-binding cassette domain-containing protein [Vulcanisaeta distributa]|uniref:ATP-binding cassette domain-containing protein n=1 Tax=Vulcanisaeta distributa TaxID=164451 RepID=UPI000A4BD6EF|nr:ATP-binding cassette domain-containing protein [Vulcanisaeta distributa]
MLITRLNIKGGFNGVNVNIETGPLTVITGPPGSGKSMIIELLWRVFRGIRDRVILEDLSRVGDARVEITISLDDRVKRKLEEVGYSGGIIYQLVLVLMMVMSAP